MFGPEWDMMSAEAKADYLRMLNNIPPAKRLQKACELSEMVTRLAIAGIKFQNPELTEKQVLGRLAYRKLPRELADKIVEAMGLR